MKKYFNIDESLEFLNKGLEEIEKMSKVDLFYFCAKKDIDPCFYLTNVNIFWEEPKESGNYHKVYPIYNASGYFSTKFCAKIILDSLQLNLNSMSSIKWVHEIDTIYSYIPDYIESAVLCSELQTESLTDAYIQNKIRFSAQLSSKEVYHGLDKNFNNYIYEYSDGIEISFDVVFFTKSQLLEIKAGLDSDITTQTNELENENQQLKDQLAQAQQRIKELEASQSIENQPLHPRTRNGAYKIIAVLADMAELPDEPFTAFNMIQAHANSIGLEVPEKDTTAGWLKDSKNT